MLVQGGEPLLLFNEIAPELSEPLRMKTVLTEGLFMDTPVEFSGSARNREGGKRRDKEIEIEDKLLE